jgi:hypothetical protein
MAETIIILAASLVLAATYGVHVTIMLRRADKKIAEVTQHCDELAGHCDMFAETITDIAKGEASARIVNGNVVCQRRYPRAPHRKTPIH